MRIRRIICAVLLAALMLPVSGAAAEETPKFVNPQSAVKYVKANQPTALTIEGVKWTPKELYSVRKAMPEGSEFHFSTEWGGITVTDEAEDLDLTGIKKAVTGEDLEALVLMCPKIKRIDNSKKRSPSNNVMIPLVEKYPDVQFEWVVHLGGSHYVATTETAFSTFNEPFDPDSLSSKQLMKLKYCPRMKALDLGHNRITDLEFLQYVPDLEFLIVGDNMIKDLTPISQLKHLQYAELFSNYFTDITPLASCTELIDLNICYARVTDFSVLDNLENLERFWATMIRGLPEEEKERFKRVHPNVEVDFEGSHATTNGWRKHPRYKHYIWCLKNRTWIPFDQPLPTEQP